MSAVALVHLVYGPLGVAPLERFLAELERHPPGVQPRLVFVLKAFATQDALAQARALTVGLEHDELVIAGGEYDLASYRRAAAACDEPMLAFVNSAARPLVDGWLATLLDALSAADVGMVSATGSYESALSAAPRPLRPLRRLEGYRPFPNPHLRTNAFALSRRVLDRLRWGRPRTKGAALRLESGRHGLTRQVEGLGLRTLVVGAGGRTFASSEWPASRTFRSGAQENLLVADNRTQQYADASEVERRRLAAMAWGEFADR